MELPQPIGEQLLADLISGKRHAYVTLDGDGRVRECGGDLSWFGIDPLTVGEPLAGAVEALLAGAEAGPTVLPRIELVAGRSADVHVGGTAAGPFLLFVDATQEARRELNYQQRGNELGLTLRALGVAVFEHLDSGALRRLGPRPAWMRALCSEPAAGGDPTLGLAFLGNFLQDAEVVWRQRSTRPLWSGMWVEQDERGNEWHLEAHAILLEDGRRILVVQSAERRYEERQNILQRARDHSLDFDRLRREIDKKELLLHCIIHDLRGPLASMMGSMSLVNSRDLDAEQTQELLELGLQQAHHQEDMIRSILEAFRAEVESMESFESEAGRAPDLRACIDEALLAYEHVFGANEVELRLRTDHAGACPVVGERSRLYRVVCNLLENARRFSPAGGTVQVSIDRIEEGYRVRVEDEGGGVPPELVGSLFQRFQQGRAKGVAGLGLYFCRTTLEKWGGSIGYEPAASGGAGFWFELRAAE